MDEESSLKSEEGVKLRKFEERMFQNVKSQIVKERKSQWQGSKDENMYADEKIIALIQKDLKMSI